MKKLGVALLVAAILLLLIEVGLRLAGISPDVLMPKNDFNCTPNEFWKKDSVLGIKYFPGNFTCTAGNEVVFSVTHGSDGYRTCGPEKDSTAPAIALFGGSVCWGHGLEDFCTLGWQLHGNTEYAVSNFGIGATGTVQSYLQLKSVVDARKLPEEVVLLYGSFHDMRNTSSWQWRKAFYGFLSNAETRKQYRDLKVPAYRQFNTDGSEGISLVYLSQNELLNALPGFDKSALLFLLNEIYQVFWCDRELDDQQASIALLLEMNRLVNSNQARFTVVGVFDDQETLSTLQLLENQGVNVLLPFSSMGEEKWTIPKDGHPNCDWNAELAKRLMAELDLY
jgi:hypothetical protein